MLTAIQLQALDQQERNLESTSSAPLGNTILSIAYGSMTPDQALYSNHDKTTTLMITGAISVAGLERFHRVPLTNGRYLLRLRDDLALSGECAGPSSVVLDWLRHGEDTLTLPGGRFRLRDFGMYLAI
jgi:hypothetical protein